MRTHWGVLAVVVAVALLGFDVADQAARPARHAGARTAARIGIVAPKRDSARSGTTTHVVSSGRSTATADDAPGLPSVAVWQGASSRQIELSDGATAFTARFGMVGDTSVACWSDRDWPSVSGERPNAAYSTLGIWQSSQPRWVHLAPSTCTMLQTLLTARPTSASPELAEAVTTLTHELYHSLGVGSEAKAECFAMQSTPMMARLLGVPRAYAGRLGRLTLAAYAFLEPLYRDARRCRDGGVWDLHPGWPSAPWHVYTG